MAYSTRRSLLLLLTVWFHTSPSITSFSPFFFHHYPFLRDLLNLFSRQQDYVLTFQGLRYPLTIQWFHACRNGS